MAFLYEISNVENKVTPSRDKSYNGSPLGNLELRTVGHSKGPLSLFDKYFTCRSSSWEMK